MAGFMRLHVWREKAVEVVRDGDTIIVPESEVFDSDKRLKANHGAMWFACYSASGYMDKTDTVGPYLTPADAARECFSLFGNDEVGGGDRAELARFFWNIRKEGLA